MKTMIDLCIVPIGVGVSLSGYVAECQKILGECNVSFTLHAYGTNIEGEWDDVFAAVKKCHQRLHQMNVPRIATTIKVGTRTDRQQSLNDKIRSVEEKL